MKMFNFLYYDWKSQPVVHSWLEGVFNIDHKSSLTQVKLLNMFIFYLDRKSSFLLWLSLFFSTACKVGIRVWENGIPPPCYGWLGWDSICRGICYIWCFVNGNIIWFLTYSTWRKKGCVGTFSTFAVLSKSPAVKFSSAQTSTVCATIVIYSWFHCLQKIIEVLKGKPLSVNGLIHIV